MSRSIDDLLSEVPEGQSRSFKATITDANNDRFVEVAYNWDYGTVISWNNRPPLLDHPPYSQLPWTGARRKPRIGLSSLAEPDITFRRNVEELVDFHSTGTGAHIISSKLLALIERLDPESLEVIPVVIKARNGNADFDMVMPNRLLHAVDADRCDVDVIDEKLDTIWVRKVRFPKGAIFDPEISMDIHNFADIDVMNRWFWSRELVDEAKICGIKGLYTKKPGGLASQQFDQL